MPAPPDELDTLLRLVRQRQLTLAIAEGDTGGLLLEWLTAVPGSSAVVLGGIVAYHDSLKLQLLRVPEALLRQHGAVSEQSACAMASGVRALVSADVGIATTGIAGPGGATREKPVGLAWVAVAFGSAVFSRQHHWHGTREANRAASAAAALALALEHLQ